MTNGMSTPEFFGIFLAAAASVSSVLFMMIGYQTAKLRHFKMMLRYLRLAGLLSMASWVVMLAVMFRCEHVCWVVRNSPIEAKPIVTDDIVYTVKTTGGHSLQWEHKNAGLPTILGRSGQAGRTVRSGSGRL